MIKRFSKVVQYLLDNGWELSPVDAFGLTPIDYAEKRQSSEIHISLSDRGTLHDSVDLRIITVKVFNQAKSEEVPQEDVITSEQLSDELRALKLRLDVRISISLVTFVGCEGS